MELYYLDKSKIPEHGWTHLQGKICDDNCIPRPVKKALLNLLGNDATLKDGVEVLLPNVFQNLKKLHYVGDLHAAQFINYLSWLGVPSSQQMEREQIQEQIEIAKTKAFNEIQNSKKKELQKIKKQIDAEIKQCLNNIGKIIELKLKDLDK